MQKSIFKFFLGVFIASLLISCSELKNSTSGSKDPDPAPGTTGNSQSLIRVTSDPIPEFYPKISPDGKRMVFHIRDDNKQGTDKFSIMMMTLGQPGRIPLIGSNTELPSFMNDSKSIVYSYNKPAKPIIAKSSVEGASGINYIGNSNLGDWDSHPCVSPDGKKILFHTKFGDTYQIASIEMSGVNTTILTEGFSPSFHPSGLKFVYNKRVGKFEQIFEYNFQTGQSLQLTTGEFDSSDPSYSADGKNIVFSSTRDNRNEHIFYMHSDGTSITQLTQGNSKNAMATFAPNNDIYFCSNAGTSKLKNPNGQFTWSNSDIWKITPLLQ